MEKIQDVLIFNKGVKEEQEKAKKKKKDLTI